MTSFARYKTKVSEIMTNAKNKDTGNVQKWLLDALVSRTISAPVRLEDNGISHALHGGNNPL